MTKPKFNLWRSLKTFWKITKQVAKSLSLAEWSLIVFLALVAITLLFFQSALSSVLWILFFVFLTFFFIGFTIAGFVDLKDTEDKIIDWEDSLPYIIWIVIGAIIPIVQYVVIGGVALLFVLFVGYLFYRGLREFGGDFFAFVFRVLAWPLWKVYESRAWRIADTPSKLQKYIDKFEYSYRNIADRIEEITVSQLSNVSTLASYEQAQALWDEVSISPDKQLFKRKKKELEEAIAWKTLIEAPGSEELVVYLKKHEGIHAEHTIQAQRMLQETENKIILDAEQQQEKRSEQRKASNLEAERQREAETQNKLRSNVLFNLSDLVKISRRMSVATPNDKIDLLNEFSDIIEEIDEQLKLLPDFEFDPEVHFKKEEIEINLKHAVPNNTSIQKVTISILNRIVIKKIT